MRPQLALTDRDLAAVMSHFSRSLFHIMIFRTSIQVWRLIIGWLALVPDPAR
jgi:hypothetical protein